MSDNPVGRPEKNTVDYFQHDCLPKDTLKVLEDNWRNDGYAFWFKLLETLGRTEGHYLNLNEKGKMKLLCAKTHLNSEQCTDILDTLSELEAIDPNLWRNKIVWCQNFVHRISHLYSKRVNGLPVVPDKKLIEKLVTNGSRS